MAVRHRIRMPIVLERISREQRRLVPPEHPAPWSAARINYAREEPEGGPLLKGRKKLAATSFGDLY
jgi:hypothetical protein